MNTSTQNAAPVNSDPFTLAYSAPSDPIQALPLRVRILARFLAKPTWTPTEVGRMTNLCDRLEFDDEPHRDILAQLGEELTDFNRTYKRHLDILNEAKPRPTLPKLPVRILRVTPADMLEGARGAYQRRGDMAIVEHWDDLSEADRKKVGLLLVKLGFGKLTRKLTAFARFSDGVRNQVASPVAFAPAETSFEPAELPEHLELPEPIGIMMEADPIMEESESSGDLPDWSPPASLPDYAVLDDYPADDFVEVADDEDDDFIEVPEPEASVDSLIGRWYGVFTDIAWIGRCLDRTERNGMGSAIRSAWESADDSQLGSILRMIVLLGYARARRPDSPDEIFPGHWCSDFDQFSDFAKLCAFGSPIRLPIPPIDPIDRTRMESVADSTLSPLEGERFSGKESSLETVQVAIENILDHVTHDFEVSGDIPSPSTHANPLPDQSDFVVVQLVDPPSNLLDPMTSLVLPVLLGSSPSEVAEVVVFLDPVPMATLGPIRRFSPEGQQNQSMNQEVATLPVNVRPEMHVATGVLAQSNQLRADTVSAGRLVEGEPDDRAIVADLPTWKVGDSFIQDVRGDRLGFSHDLPILDRLEVAVGAEPGSQLPVRPVSLSHKHGTESTHSPQPSEPITSAPQLHDAKEGTQRPQGEALTDKSDWTSKDDLDRSQSILGGPDSFMDTIEIKGEMYWVVVSPDGIELSKPGSPDHHYIIDGPNGPECTCSSHKFRPGPCKHLVATHAQGFWPDWTDAALARINPKVPLVFPEPAMV